MRHEAEDAEAVVDGDQDDVLGGPFLRVELRLGAPSLAIAAAVDPHGHGGLAVHLARVLGPHVQIQAVLAALLLFAITPLREIVARIVDGLVARMAEFVGLQDALPGHHRLRRFPAQVADGRRGIRDPLVDEDAVEVGGDTLHLSPFDVEDGADFFGTIACAQRHGQGEQREESDFHIGFDYGSRHKFKKI